MKGVATTPAVRLTVIVGRSAHYHHHSVAAEVVRLARRTGLAGATVLAGVEGYGSSHQLHRASTGSPAWTVSYVVVVVDSAEAVARFEERLGPVLAGRGVHFSEQVERLSRPDAADAGGDR
ncbi:MAG TPA: DUF190 domain-containing protein [Acidimicrobiales bacterium]|nr:DUF190 domain-containing protein [Acidimicrobiales bacterium]